MEMAIIDINNMGVTTVGRIDRSSDLFPELKSLEDYAGSFYKTICANSRRIEARERTVHRPPGDCTEICVTVYH